MDEWEATWLHGKLAAEKVGPGAHEGGNKDESENRKAGKKKKSLKQQLDLLISCPLWETGYGSSHT